MPEPPEPQRPQLGLGRAVQQLREEAKLPQQSLASHARMSPSRLSQIECGEEDPTWGEMRDVAQGLSVPLESLAELAEELEPESSGGPDGSPPPPPNDLK